MNKKFVIGLCVLVVICAAVITINFLIAFREKAQFSPALPQADTTIHHKEVFSEDNTAILPQKDYEAVEEDSNGQPFLLN